MIVVRKCEECGAAARAADCFCSDACLVAHEREARRRETAEPVNA